jgi:hypothetical protein
LCYLLLQHAVTSRLLPPIVVTLYQVHRNKEIHS